MYFSDFILYEESNPDDNDSYRQRLPSKFLEICQHEVDPQQGKPYSNFRKDVLMSRTKQLLSLLEKQVDVGKGEMGFTRGVSKVRRGMPQKTLRNMLDASPSGPVSARNQNSRTNLSSSDYLEKYRTSRHSTCFTDRKSRRSLRSRQQAAEKDRSAILHSSRIYKKPTQNMTVLNIHSKKPVDSGVWLKKPFLDKDIAYLNLQNYYVQKYGSVKQNKRVVEEKVVNYDINPW